MANHADLPSSEWHPAYPPGVDAATSGDVFVSDGVGTGGWTSIDSLLESDKSYAQLSSVSSTIGVTQATDASLQTDLDYINLTTLSMWEEDGSKDVTVDSSNGIFTVNKDGTYLLNFWVDHSIDGSTNENVGFKFSKNGVLDTKTLISTSDFSGDIRNSSAAGIIFSLVAGDIIRVHVACTKAVTLTLHSSQLNIVRL